MYALPKSIHEEISDNSTLSHLDPKFYLQTSQTHAHTCKRDLDRSGELEARPQVLHIT